jgi:hypothetical protein
MDCSTFLMARLLVSGIIMMLKAALAISSAQQVHLYHDGHVALVISALLM